MAHFAAEFSIFFFFIFFPATTQSTGSPRFDPSQLEWFVKKHLLVSKKDPECWLILFAQLYRTCFSSILENTILFQILG